MPSVLRVILGRLIASLVGGLATWLASKGINLDAESTAAIVTTLMTIFSVVYGLVHTTVNARINPADVSSPSVATAVEAEKR